MVIQNDPCAIYNAYFRFQIIQCHGISNKIIIYLMYLMIPLNALLGFS